MDNNLISQELYQEVAKLSKEDKLCLIAAMLDVDPEPDETGQLVFYTGMAEDDEGDIVDLYPF